MKIALVHDFLFKMGGAERVLKEMADLFPNAPIYTLLYHEAICGNIFPKDRIIPSFLQNAPRYFRKKPHMLLSKMPQAIESFDFSRFDLVISSSGAFSHGVITSPKTRHLCYCHSPMRYAWDYSHEYLDEKNFSWPKEWMVRKILYSLRQWDRACADRPDQYLANSHHVAKRLKKYFQVDAKILYPPVDVDRFYPYAKAEKFFVIISALSSFKKIDLAITAFNKMKKPLKIIGDGSERRRLERLAGPTISFLGRLSDEETRKVLQSSQALIFPGEEDFGITPVEAMAAGKPVIAYGKGGVLETVLEDVTGIFFYEPSPASLENAIAAFFEKTSKGHFSPTTIHERAQLFHRKYFREGLQTCIASLV